MKNSIPWVVFIGIAAAVAVWFWSMTTDAPEVAQVTVPTAVVEDEPVVEESIKQESEPEEFIIPESAQLDVPFTSQAPYGNWDLPYQEACEEASMLMAARFVQGRSIDGAEDADEGILQLVDFVEDSGFPIDITAVETATLMTDFYGIQTRTLSDFTWEDIKAEIVQGNPVIIPAAGQQLGNPNFTAPGPLYHMLVITGYTPNGVVTNDPGTRNGEGYVYGYDVLMNAIHDWNNGNVEQGEKVVIVVEADSE